MFNTTQEKKMDGKKTNRHIQSKGAYKSDLLPEQPHKIEFDEKGVGEIKPDVPTEIAPKDTPQSPAPKA